MTTIAWDGDNLAADSQTTRDFHGEGSCEHCHVPLRHTLNETVKVQIPSRKEPVLFNEQQLIAVAGAGDAGMVGLYRKGILLGVPLQTINSMAHETHKLKGRVPSAYLLVVTDQAVYEVQHTSFRAKVKEITQVPYALGTGASAAELAMKRLGLTAMAAVACAIDVDTYSGGYVNYISCRGEVGTKVESYKYTPEDVNEFFV